MRQVILDTETTGLSPQQGHRIIEIGCVEMINRRLTGREFHHYLQPDRKIDPGATHVHGITNDQLKGKPRFKQIAEDLKIFLKGAELIIHNATFDIGFIENEFALIKDEQWENVEDHCEVTDTLSLARKKHPGQRNNLDALCKRYNVSLEHRTKHGALLDAQILSQVYLAMTGGQNTLVLEDKDIVMQEKSHASLIAPVMEIIDLCVIKPTEEEMLEHLAFEKTLGGTA